MNQILEKAQEQYGYVAAHQIESIRAAVNHQVKQGHIKRVERGIYRVVNYPLFDHEELMVAYLWSKHRAIFSHETALYLHDLSDVLPGEIHLTLPREDMSLRRTIPDLYNVYFKDVESDWYDVLPITTVPQTLIDVACTGLDMDQLRMAVKQAKARGQINDDFEWTLIQQLQFKQ